ncbi:MAG: helix-turn-helix domain-containing protein [Prevotellaceae bacterium]|jgi:AraC-like DNA-binding protein|nr:helix-turn-helix domain-containing protein [Prevotellaceae bacterium]
MKRKVIQISPAEIFKIFENDSIENSFVASDNISDIVTRNKIEKENILNFPFRSNEAIMLVCVCGCMKAKLATRNFTLEKNAVLTILPKQIFEITEFSSDFNSIVFIMKTSFWNKKDSFLEAMELQQHFFNEGGMKLPESNMKEIITIYRLIKDKIAEKGLFSRQIIQQYIYVLFYNVYALLQQKNIQERTEKPPTKEYVFGQFIRLVERNYKEQHEIGFYADKLNLTGKYLSALIRSASGKTAAQWIREHLIMEARTLLKSGKMSIQQVSNELNFYDQSHFGVFFKKYVGCSPREYQKM